MSCELRLRANVVLLTARGSRLVACCFIFRTFKCATQRKPHGITSAGSIKSSSGTLKLLNIFFSYPVYNPQSSKTASSLRQITKSQYNHRHVQKYSGTATRIMKGRQCGLCTAVLRQFPIKDKWAAGCGQTA